MLIRAAEIDGRAPLDVRCEDDRIIEIDARIDARPGETVADAHGGALLPGLHDHHIHLTALAAARLSVECGPPAVGDARALRATLQRAAGMSVQAGARPGDAAWIRGVGYHESVAGNLDRDVLDGMLASRPLRIQHRTGAAWFLNSHACKTLRLDEDLDETRAARGVERDTSGRATGRLFRLDAWLAERTRNASRPSLAAISRELAACGVTGVTDATYTNDTDALAHIAAAAAAGELLQAALVMGTHALPDAPHPGVRTGAVKIMIDERDPPLPEMLGESIARAHACRRVVAIHCVTRVELVLACAALAAAGAVAGDRVEHASIAPPELARQLAALGVTVVTQPSFVRERGDRYLVDVDERDLPWLYRLRGFDEAGVALAGGTDAPYGSADPWAAMLAALQRTTVAGQRIGPGEAISPERALALFTSSPKTPGGSPRAVRVGAAADLVLLREPWSSARQELSSDLVAATIRDGRIIWRAAS